MSKIRNQTCWMLAAALLFCAGVSPAVELKLDLKKGEKFASTTTMTQKTAADAMPGGMETTMETALFSDLEVTDVRNGPVFVVKQTITRVKIKGSAMGQSYEFDSGEEEATDDMKDKAVKAKTQEEAPPSGDKATDEMWDDFQKEEEPASGMDIGAMIGEQFKNLIGETSIREVDAWGNVLSEETSDALAAMSSTDTRSFFGGPVLAKGKDLKPGDTWGNTSVIPAVSGWGVGDIAITNTFKGFQEFSGKRCAHIESVSSLGKAGNKASGPNSVKRAGKKSKRRKKDASEKSPEGWEDFTAEEGQSPEDMMSNMMQNITGNGTTTLYLEEATCVPLQEKTSMTMNMQMGPMAIVTKLATDTRIRRKK